MKWLWGGAIGVLIGAIGMWALRPAPVDRVVYTDRPVDVVREVVREVPVDRLVVRWQEREPTAHATDCVAMRWVP